MHTPFFCVLKTDKKKSTFHAFSTSIFFFGISWIFGLTKKKERRSQVFRSKECTLFPISRIDLLRIEIHGILVKIMIMVCIFIRSVLIIRPPLIHNHGVRISSGIIIKSYFWYLIQLRCVVEINIQWCSFQFISFYNRI